jgi:signal peptidase II
MSSKLPVTLGVAGAILLIDQATKALAVAALEGTLPVEVIGTLLRLNLARNPGAAFSLAGGYTILISCLAIGVTFFILRTARTLSSAWWAVVLGGVLGGALGNLMDRLFRAPGPFRGHVVDFLQLPNWPVFNVADMALVGSAILAVVLSIVGVDMAATDSRDSEGPGGQPAAAETGEARPDA